MTMELPTKKKIELIFFSVPKKRQQKYGEMHKMIPGNHTLLVCFLEQRQNADRMSGILDQLRQERKEMVLKKSSTKTSSLSDCDRQNKSRRHNCHHTHSHDCNDGHDCHHDYNRRNCNDRYEHSDHACRKQSRQHRYCGDRDKPCSHFKKADDCHRNQMVKHHIMYNDAGS